MLSGNVEQHLADPFEELYGLLERDTQQLQARNCERQTTGELSMVDIYNKDQFREALGKLEERDPRYCLYEGLLATPNTKFLAQVTTEMLIKLEQLKKSFPNFEQVTSDIKEILELEFMGDCKTIKTSPVLLSGPPGTGKTRYANEVSKILNVGDVRQIDLASASAGFIIGGNSTKWKDGGQGLVTKHLQESKCANPMILLDEIDKPANNGHNPLGSLFNLLERHTAETFTDEALELPMNCSHIIWFATANSLDDIPDPIKSRFDIYHVEMPSPQQMRNVIDSVYGELLSNNDWGMSFSSSLSHAVVTELNSRSPRDLYKALWKACAKAVQRDRCYINKMSGLIDLLPIDFGQYQYQYEPKQAIGFY